VTAYRAAALAEFVQPPDEPLGLLQLWLAHAQKSGELDPTTAVLATVDSSGQPSTRCLGVKSCDERGLILFMNLDTRKGSDLGANPRAAATLYWPAAFRQVNIAGRVEFTSDAESDQLWSDRGLPGQAATMASNQGARLQDHSLLAARAAQLASAGELTPRPAGQVGVVLVPEAIEFWSGRADRIHHRLHYGRTVTGWQCWLLQP
jgi:pyridoxamine 5'-phosphate oxidase